MVFKIIKIQFLVFIFILNNTVAKAQCGTFISTFPYSENFEAAPAWTSGGTNSDWAWGTPAHPTINTAGGGTKSWTVGGLTGSFYNYSEQSWLMSPCFDFTTLNYPWISFKIFWEDEWKYDGMVLQYSLTSGATWNNVGAYGDAVNCLNDNWYNYNSVTWLTTASPKHGWTGRSGATSGSCQGGNGSLAWITAKHCMSSLAGQPNVRFRFLFGSGTTCNSYDGISIDDIFIDNAPPNVANFTFACAAANTINFTNTSLMCPTGYVWDFGDGATSSLTNPSHTYTTAGTYNVMLTANGPCNASGTITIPVSILAATTTITTISCNGANDGMATATVVGSASPFTYSWTSGGATTSSVSGLAAGSYTVSVSAAGSCSATATAIITEPLALTASTTATPVSCYGGTNGTSTVTATGGTSPYNYAWSPSGGTANTASALALGTYTVTVTDQHGCTTSATALVTQPLAPLSQITSSTPVSCFGGNNGTATSIAAGGTLPYTYSWLPSGGALFSATGLVSGTYTVNITDANGCTNSSTTVIIQPLAAITATTSNTAAVCTSNNGTATVSAAGGTAPYTYLWSPVGGATSTTAALAPGTYTVTITDANGCVFSPTTTIVSTGGITAGITSTPIHCFGDMDGTALATATGGTGPYLFSWTGLQTTAAITNLAAGNYCVLITDATGCSNTACVDIPAPAPINADFTSDPSITDIYNPEIQFTDISLDGNTWLWNFGDSTGSANQNPLHVYPTEGTFPVTLIVTNSMGCIDSITHNIIISNGFTFYAPNAFTPNHNGNNDIFLPIGTDWNTATFHLWIYDRWGNMIFQTQDTNKGWDGKVTNKTATSQIEVYVWKVKLYDKRGNEHNYIGSVSVIR
jgi:gliding motility-associated-like protein